MQEVGLEDFTAALRSRKYTQGRERLASTDSETGEIQFCCLGVLCDLAGLPLISDEDGEPYFHDPEHSWEQVDFPLEYHPPERLHSALPLGVEFEDLIAMNDSGEYTFEDIADYLEEQDREGWQ